MLRNLGKACFYGKTPKTSIQFQRQRRCSTHITVTTEEKD